MRNKAINELSLLAEQNKDIVLITGDLGYNVLNSFSDKFPKRFLNVGIAEQNMIGVAAGLALSGHTVFTYSIANFGTLRCLEQIRVDICYHQANVKVISVGAGFSYGNQGYTHYAIEDIAILRSLPQMRVFSPADPIEAVMLIKHLCRFNGPGYLRLGRGGEPSLHTKAIDEIADLEQIPMLPLIKENHKHVILASGPVCGRLFNEVKKERLHFDLYSVPSIKPIDLQTLEKLIKQSKEIITVEEHQLDGGFGSAVLEACQFLYEHKKISKMPSIQRCGISNIIPKIVGSQKFMQDRFLNIDKILNKISV